MWISLSELRAAAFPFSQSVWSPMVRRGGEPSSLSTTSAWGPSPRSPSREDISSARLVSFTVTLVHVSADGEATVADGRLGDAGELTLRSDHGPVAVYSKWNTPEQWWVVQLDAHGRPQSDPVAITAAGVMSPRLVRPGLLLDVHGSLVDGRDRLEVRRIDPATGSLQGPIQVLADLPHEFVGSHHLGVTVVDLADLVVLWTRGDLVEGLMAARIRR